jgi:CTP:molybdopterin cytidylyltransferase MocA
VTQPRDTHTQADSLRLGVAGLSENIDAVMVLPVDMPALTRQDLVALIGAYKHADERIEFVGPMVGTRPGNPVLFSRRIATQILRGEGEFGSGAWRHHQPGWLLEWQTDNPHYVADIDTPEDLERYL